MPVTAQTPVNSSTGNGVTTVFPYTFKILAVADLLVTVDGVTKTLTTDYSVSGVGVDGGGNVTFVSAPANGTTVVRARNMIIERTTDYQENGDLPAATLDDDIDRVVMIEQQISEAQDRSLKLALGSVGISTELPEPAAGNVFGWNDAEDAIENKSLVGTGVLDENAVALKSAIQSQSYTRATTGGSSTAYTLDLTPNLANNNAGQRVRARFHTAAGSSPTLAVDAQAAMSLKYRDSTGALTTPTSTQIPGNWETDCVSDGTYWVMEATADNLTVISNGKKGSDVASASTTDLDTVTGDLIDVTGTTTITAITLAEGRERTVRFTGVLTLTNGASLVLPGGANITTAAGDFATFRGYSGGVVRCSNYSAIGGGSSGKIKQIVFAHKTDTFSTTSTTYTDLTGLSVSLTPTNSSNKVLILASVVVAESAANHVNLVAVRDSTIIVQGDTAGSRIRATATATPTTAYVMIPNTVMAIDSPGDTSAHTYKLQMSVTGGTGYVNRSSTDTDSATYSRSMSTIIALEYEP